MVRLEQAVIMNREAQSSDTAMFRKDLPKSGFITALDIGIRCTNGSTSNQSSDMLDMLKHISLVLNGNDYRVHMSGQEMFRHYWMKHGRPMPYIWTQAASGVQECWFRMEFGRFLGDPVYGLDLAKFQSSQVQIDYDVTLCGAIAATTFATGTFTVTIIAHQFPYNKGPAFRGMIGAREFYTVSTAASGDLVQDLPVANPIYALSIMCIEDAIADGTDITDIEIGLNNFTQTVLKGKWYNFQAMQNADLDVREEIFKLFADDAQTVDTHMTAIKSAIAVCRAVTTAVA